MADLKQWLEALGLAQHAAVLAENDIDLDVLPDLSDQDLAQLGLSLGHRRKLMAAAARLSSQATPAAAALQPSEATPQSTHDVPPPATPAPQQAERRQVTVLFSDLVGSTEISTRLDPEDLGRLIRQYQDACAGAIARFDGFLAKFLGDGVLAYFGYPQAHEDSAERAVRAGLEIVAAMERIGDGAHKARVGIATGLVVVGEMVGTGAAQEQSIVGETPNLAARLQALAAPNSVVVAGITRRLLGDLFDYDFLGEHALKGFDRPLGVWRVLRENEAKSRFRAVRAAGPLVGREQEIGLLLARWHQARAGEGQVVLLSGEAGIGKSRLVEALMERIGDEMHVHILMQCSPYHKNTAFYPVTRHLAEASGFAPEDSVETRRGKLRAMLAATSAPSDEEFGLLAGLMELGEVATTSQDMTGAQHKNRLLAVLADRLVALARSAPVLLLVEDATWIDPSTQELIGRIIDRLEGARVLAVITHRPDFVPPWTARPFVTALAFNRLSAGDCAAIVRNLAAQGALSSDLLDEILRRSDGVPLFLEELTKTVLEAGMSRAPTVPPTLQDSLMARLDRLGRAKDVAQIAAVIGREFSRPLLTEIAQLEAADLDRSLEKLVEAGLVFPRGGRAEVSYAFKHALVHEAAYESLLKARRQILHTQIGRALVSKFDADDSEPEVAAYHFGRAGMFGEASRYWERAGDKSVTRSGYAEAEANFQAALAATRELAPSADRARRLLTLQLKRGPALIVTKGFGSDEYPAAYQEAYALSRELGEGPDLFQALWGLWIADLARQRFEPAAKFADELIALSQRLGDDDLLLEAVHCRWSTAHFHGDTPLALELSREGIRRYDPVRHAKFANEYAGHDPGVCARGVAAIALCLSGFLEQGKSTAEANVVLAETLDHSGSLVHALNNTLTVYQATGDHENCLRTAERLLEIAHRLNLGPPRMIGELHAGWAQIQRGDTARGLDLVEAAFARRSLYAIIEYYICAVAAQSLAAAGRTADALAIVTSIVGDAAQSQLGWFVPELWRLKGELLLASSGQGHDEAQSCIERAIEMAQGQGALLLQLRAATSLSRLLADAGDPAAAGALLRPLYAQFSEGLETPDLVAARRMLAALP
jgi:class 3 adenylate cyclase/ABC-type Mn2+/Zn2+ transport system ATPase subunit